MDISRWLDMKEQGDKDNMGVPKWLDKKKSVRKKSDKLVKKTSKKLGMDMVVNSGACWGHKGDIKSEDMLGEHKMTEKKQTIIKEETLSKIHGEAAMAGKFPFFIIEFKDYMLIGEVRKR